MTYTNFIFLNQGTHVAEGGSKYIYPHPDNPELLIKISKITKEKWINNHPITFKKYHRFFRHWLREVAEYTRLRLHFAPNPPPTGFIQNITGLVDTNLGFGFVVKAEKDEHGEYAKTLEQIVSQGHFNQHVLNKVNEFLFKLSVVDICIHDLRPANLVYSYDLEQGYSFVLVDGLGDNTLISISPYCAAMRRYRRNKQINKLRAQLPLLLKENAINQTAY